MKTTFAGRGFKLTVFTERKSSLVTSYILTGPGIAEDSGNCSIYLEDLAFRLLDKVDLRIDWFHGRIIEKVGNQAQVDC